ncbi:hypothetical protein GGTG_11082 [Gaeumannomyces tritici R3-111a-1]|uniref:Uncharacterized protein n=1 Tax=Gaeumannomyces tritici (strain R3-111a-1) TaxID=644352 RepID=J3PC59_GAET3|nr:hypothetical protein GGTG_11082 [Gaeumannomyces tritici R3-111a-1]EJT71829.1 hypothetical protein GGTG_11082 [Gaeumannomyces tritici R3-111a-1]
MARLPPTPVLELFCYILLGHPACPRSCLHDVGAPVLGKLCQWLLNPVRRLSASAVRLTKRIASSLCGTFHSQISGRGSAGTILFPEIFCKWECHFFQYL